MNPLFAAGAVSIFERMSLLARAHDAVNLGQGFPDFGWPQAVLDKAAEALAGSNQYPPMRGLPALREAVADHYRRHQGLAADAEQVTITSGATEALAAALFALIAPGDEVGLIQPLYDLYLPIVRRAGGVPRLARLEPPGWRITPEVVAEAIGPRTRLLVLNNPHNPTARMFDAEELELIAAACRRHDVRVLSDEVWEHVALDERRHLPLAALPGMAERVVKVGSAGKIFSLTGWKVGWAVAPEPLIGAVTRAHQFLAFTTPPNLQAAVAFGLGLPDAVLDEMRRAFGEARDDMRDALKRAGLAALPSEGSYFLNVDLAASGIAVGDEEFCLRAVRDHGVAAIPVSAFYAERPVTHVVRLCFAKRAETRREGLERLAAAAKAMRAK